MTKVCTKCGEEKPLEEFHKGHLRNKFGRAAYCKPCENRRTRNYRKNNKDKVDWGNYKRRYGITREEYEELDRSQNSLCAICGTTYTKKRLHVDHNHETGKVRGLLCNNCNRALGYFKDSKEILEKAAKYLNENN